MFSRPSFSSCKRTLSSITSALVASCAETLLATQDLIQLNADSDSGGKGLSVNFVAASKMCSTYLGEDKAYLALAYVTLVYRRV